MKWLKDTLTSLKEAAAAAPIECPRGWGPVAFTFEFEGFFPFWDIERRCPIGGVSSCEKCRHPCSPDRTGELRESLERLQALLRDGTLTAEEHALRRRMLIGLTDASRPPPGFGMRVAAWIVGPMGLVLTGAGLWLTREFHRAFVALTIGGILLLGLCLSFGVLASMRSGEEAAKPAKPKY